LPVGRTFSSTAGIGPPEQSERHPERSEPARLICTRWAGGGSAHENQILRTWETVLRMTEGFGNGGPPRLGELLVGRPARRTCTLRAGGDAVSTPGHREVDVGHCGLPARQPVGCTPPRRYEQARESIVRRLGVNRYNRSDLKDAVPGTYVIPARLKRESRLRFLDSRQRSRSWIPLLSGIRKAEHSGVTRVFEMGSGNIPKVIVNANTILGRCNATRFCASDAVHEFPRICFGGFPMSLFRRTGFPQLLLMRPSSLCKGVVGQRHRDEAFS
jgi:hypothetical protein